MKPRKNTSKTERLWFAVGILFLILPLAAVILYTGCSSAIRCTALAVFSLSLLWLAAILLNIRKRTHRFILCLNSLILGDDSDTKVPSIIPDSVSLLEKLDERLTESATAGALKTEAELHALQNQINPHFLYNTLEIIRSRALIQGNQDVAEMVESLALQFRYCINNQGELATLRQELDHVHNYLLIQRYRFGDRIQYREIIPDSSVMDCRLPLLTLQPIIENALIHGVNPKVDGGCITLRIRASSKRLYISIEDNGVGIADEDLKKMRESLLNNVTSSSPKRSGHSSGIAMGNVNQRIRLYFGEHYGVDITSTVGVGTTVILTLPLTCME